MSPTAPQLHLLCLTLGEPHAARFLRAHQKFADSVRATYWPILAAPEDTEIDQRVFVHTVGVMPSRGYLESALDQALTFVSANPGDYILRLDDDEMPSPAFVAWLGAGGHLAHDHWKFPRRHWWTDDQTYIANLPLYPDHQTRLSVAAKAGGRGVIHAGSPHGGGALPTDEGIYIGHHKFLIKSREQREAIAARYDAVSPGAGTSPGMIAFQLPEVAYDAAHPMTLRYGGR